MVDKAERKILDMIEQGQISAEDGLRLMNAMGTDKETAITTDGNTLRDEEIVILSQGEQQAYSPPPISEEEMARIKKLKRWWILPFGIGLIITTLGAIWMYSSYAANGFGFGFWFSWIPFLLGVFLAAVSFQSSNGVWLHVRIKQRPGESPQRINISVPLPLGLTRWFFTTFGGKIPGLKDQPVENYSEILENLSPEEPFYVHVDEDGEEVEVFIG